jgi:glycine cleavage system H protein
MEGFSYHNIFDTKGIEYLVVIAFLLLLIPFWVALNKKPKIREKIRSALGVLSVSVLKIPLGVFHNKNHSWAYLEKSGSAKIGLDDFLLRITGNVSFRQLKNTGQIIRKGEKVAEINRNGKTMDIFSPVSGEIMRFNTALNADNRLLNEDPYGRGWIFDIKPSDWAGEIQSFYLADGAVSWLKNELGRYKDFLALNISKFQPESSHIVLQDGGEIPENSLSDLPSEMWHAFQNEFLTPQG